MKIISLLILPILLLAATPADSSQVAYNFIKAVSNDAIGYDVIISEHLCVDKAQPAELLIMQLKALRNELKEDPWVIKKYSDIPAKEQTLQIAGKDKQHIYALRSNGQLICFMLVSDGKIASFSTMDKGGSRIFLKICG